MTIERGFPLARLTTIGTGGPAAALARPRTLPELEEALRFGRDDGLDVVVVGLGSNLLAADDGVDALVLKLEGELAAVEIEGTTLRAGGGAKNAVCLHRARDAGLGGFEFACAIPGTAGGGVKMNAGAYGSDWSAILGRALIVSADRGEWRSAAELDLTYRHSSLQAGDVVAVVEYRLEPRPRDEIKQTVSELIARRKETFEAILEPDYLPAELSGRFYDTSDDSIKPRTISPARQNSDAFAHSYNVSFLLRGRPCAAQVS